MTPSIGNSNGAAPSPLPRFRPPGARKLRQASFISPSTGERTKRVFTLREASHRLSGGDEAADETTALMGREGHDEDSSRWRAIQLKVTSRLQSIKDYSTSKTGLGILKCSLAYLLGSLATYVPAIANVIGSKQASKHLVATVTVWFHPARSIGSMHEGTVLAAIAVCYAAFISFASMGISLFFGNIDKLIIGHIIVLIIFVGGGLGFIAWVKQRLGHPLVNVACSLASLGCVTILIKEGSVQEGYFSTRRAEQVLLMVIFGVIATTAVNILVLPVTARSLLVNDLEKNTDLLGEMLISITRAFLSGREGDMNDDYYKQLTKEHQSSMSAMNKDLGEAKRELYSIGRERQWSVEADIVECLVGLAQDLGGLRSAAFAQFAFINETVQEPRPASRTSSPNRATRGEAAPIPNILDVITEAPEEGDMTHANGSTPYGSPALGTPPWASRTHTPERSASVATIPATIETPSDMFIAFVTQLGPPTRSLVYTLKQILDELPFHQKETSVLWKWVQMPHVEVAVNENFSTSLRTAIELYRQSRNEALQRLYANRAINAAGLASRAGQSTPTRAFSSQRGTLNRAFSDRPSDRTPDDILADIEEVSACCGHFSFSLLDFAEDVLTYLDMLENLKTEMEAPTLSWSWVKPKWPWGPRPQNNKGVRRGSVYREADEDHDPTHGVSEPTKGVIGFGSLVSSTESRSWTYKIYKALRVFQRDDFRFAIKVGIGAVLFALPAFLASTRPTFVRWRMEWGLITYMVVCSMNIGASNAAGINRFLGSSAGAALAIIAWLIAADDGDANPWILGVFGWLVSIGCFYLILEKNEGPMGRFILLTFNLGALYSYTLSVADDDGNADEGGVDPAIWDIVLHRLVAVIVGGIWAVIVMHAIWPNSARRKLRDGLCILWLRMGLIWKRDPLAMFLQGAPRSKYMDIREEASLQTVLSNLQGLRKAAKAEFELRGPFPDETMGRILERTQRMVDAFHAINVVIAKNMQYTSGEAIVLRYTRSERAELSARISHLFSVLASSVKLEYPLNDVLPSIEHTRDRLLARISEFRRSGDGRENVTEQDYEMLYAYVLVTGQLSQDIQAVSAECETLYGTLDEESLKIQ